ncbi:hypothetical protein HWV62_15271 [Athelia sp. TMB]|nr:hypothetical protein HWV62_15271 [Athelia sp. TMB]
MSSNSVLALTASSTRYLATLAHPTFFPFPLGLVLHAARTSLAHQHLVRASSTWKSTPWSAYLAGFFILAWGGGVSSHVLLGLPPPQLYSARPWVGYLAVHLALTFLGPLLKFEKIPPRVMDTLCLPIDTLLRVISIFSALNLLTPAPGSPLQVNPLLAASPIVPLFLGAIASSGGGTLASALSVWEPEWRLRSPGWMRAGVGLRGSVDVWGGAVAAGVWCFLAGQQPFYQNLRVTVYEVLGVKPTVVDAGDARAVATLVLGTLFAWRVYGVHWAPINAENAQQQKKPKGNDAKSQ